MTTIGKAPSAYRDRKEIAIEAASRLMAKYPHSVVAVKDLQSGKATAVDFKLHGPHCAWLSLPI